MQNSKFKIQNWFCLFTFYFLLFTFACSVPNLESSECTDSRPAVKQFYSFHFANEMKFSGDNLKQREKFLTPEFAKSLQNLTGENDVFTVNSTDFPKAFRIGECKVIDPTKTNLEIVLFWRDDSRSEQKIIHVEAVKQADKWLIGKVLYDAK
jgi:hypothetical protein